MTEKTAAHTADQLMQPLASPSGTESIQPTTDPREESAPDGQVENKIQASKSGSVVSIYIVS